MKADIKLRYCCICCAPRKRSPLFNYTNNLYLAASSLFRSASTRGLYLNTNIQEVTEDRFESILEDRAAAVPLQTEL